MKTNLYNQEGQEVGKVDLPDEVFSTPVQKAFLHHALLIVFANSRKITAHSKTRGEVRGGGRKPWRQKGTGRARHGSIRSPIWVGGGVTHGPRNEKIYAKKLNKKERRKALFMALSSKVKDGQLFVVDGISLDKAKTRSAQKVVNDLSGVMPGYRKSNKKSDSILMILSSEDKNLSTSFRNIPNISMTEARSLNMRDVLEKKFTVLLKSSIPLLVNANLKN